VPSSIISTQNGEFLCISYLCAKYPVILSLFAIFLGIANHKNH